MSKQNKTKGHKVSETAPQQKKERKPWLLPVSVVFFVLVWLWAGVWYGDVLRIAREYSFWAPDETLMRYMEGRPWGGLWVAGLALLQLYRWPLVGALVTALFVAGSTWLVGYCLRLRGWWKVLQFVPAAVYLTFVAYQGFDLYFETETGRIMGVPLMCFVVLLVLALIIRSFAHGHRFPHILRPPTDETPRLNRTLLAMALLTVLLPIAVTHWMRPYVRVVTRMQRQMMEQDWKGMAETARANAELSYRQIAAYYAIALVNTNEQATHLFDIRLEYDDPYLHGYSGSMTNASNYYMMDCDLAAGLVETAIHHGMEQLTMNGPTIRTLKVLTKCALLRGEWEVAKKYLRVLHYVPFEGAWVEKYSAMVEQPELINQDAEFKMVRMTEPIHDNFENFLTPPTFLGYNLNLYEGRSMNALLNSLVVQIYTKTMPQFIQSSQPLQGSTPPKSISEALLMMSSKHPGIQQQFQGLEFHRSRMMNFMMEVKPYIDSYDHRKEHADELFPKWKGFYPYYYFFGNLKATKGHQKDKEETSKQGVN